MAIVESHRGELLLPLVRRPSPPCRPAEFCVLESPQVVLLCTGAFRQADVVHGHLAAPASPALPLQDDLVNSRKCHFHCLIFALVL